MFLTFQRWKKNIFFQKVPAKRLIKKALKKAKQENLGATSIEKIPKSSASGRNFLNPLPPYSNFDRTDENVGISYLKVIIKFRFFQISPPSPYFGRMPKLIDDVNWGGPLVVDFYLELQNSNFRWNNSDIPLVC